MNIRRIACKIGRFYRGDEKNRFLLVDCPWDFHYFHIYPLLLKLSTVRGLKITVLKWKGFCEVPIEGIRYISRKIFKYEYFKSYDFYLTTEFGTPRWFDDVLKIFFLHGIGPKVSYFARKELNDFDVILAPGPYVEEKQKQFIRDDARIFPAGLPALDRFFTGTGSTLPRTCSFDKDKPILLYAPSWSNDFKQISMDVEIIQALIEQNVCNVIFRPHPNLFKPECCSGHDFKLLVEHFAKGKDNFVIYSGINTSIYNVISNVDIIMSDISSVLYEFLIFDKPVLIYAKESLGSYYRYDDYFKLTKESCHIVNHDSDITKILEYCVEKPNALSSQRMKLLSRSLYNPGKATTVICNLFNEL